MSDVGGWMGKINIQPMLGPPFEEPQPHASVHSHARQSHRTELHQLAPTPSTHLPSTLLAAHCLCQLTRFNISHSMIGDPFEKVQSEWKFESKSNIWFIFFFVRRVCSVCRWKMLPPKTNPTLWSLCLWYWHLTSFPMPILGSLRPLRRRGCIAYRGAIRYVWSLMVITCACDVLKQVQFDSRDITCTTPQSIDAIDESQ